MNRCQPLPQSGLPLSQLGPMIGAHVHGDTAIVARGIRQDSRAIEPGDIFVARRGRHSDGLAFVHQAVSRGACAVLAEEHHAPSALPVPVLFVRDVRWAMAHAASVLYGHPTHALAVVGITGTNGKTTTSFLVHAALVRAGQHPALMGTLGVRTGSEHLSTTLNTPESDEFMRTAAWMRAGGATHLVMEVTSHAIAQQRVDAVRFRVGAFSNLTHDHLDLHGTMKAYAQAKARLFLDLSPQTSVINVDDPFGNSLASRISGSVLRVSSVPRSGADVCPDSAVTLDSHGMHGWIATPSGTVPLASPLLGGHNLDNLCLASGICVALGLDPSETAQALGSCEPVPGRLERCDTPHDDIAVFVDYAHSPDALDKVLRTVRALTSGQVLCVFGCGGDRDRAKRPVMGAVAAERADLAIVTSDNPRSESAQAIAEAVVAGTRGRRAEICVELDRARAIGLAIGRANPGDLVIVAGRGHETEQVLAGKTVHFDDREQCRHALGVRRQVRAAVL